MGRNLSLSALAVHHKRAYDAMPLQAGGAQSTISWKAFKGQPLHHFHNVIQLRLVVKVWLHLRLYVTHMSLKVGIAASH